MLGLQKQVRLMVTILLTLSVSMINCLDSFAQNNWDDTVLMQTFNSGEWDTFFTLAANNIAINGELQNWINAPENAAHRGLAYYYLGEACYNLAFNNVVNQRLYFNYAINLFRDAINTGLLQIPQRYFANYKQAWCYFRLAEICTPGQFEDVRGYLTNCLESLNQPPISNNEQIQTLRACSLYLLAEVNLRLATIEKFDHLRIRELSQQQISEIEQYLRSALARLDSINVAQVTSGELLYDRNQFERCIKLKKAEIYLEWGKLMLTLDPPDFNNSEAKLNQALDVLGNQQETQYNYFRGLVNIWRYFIGAIDKERAVNSAAQISIPHEREFYLAAIDFWDCNLAAQIFHQLASSNGGFFQSGLEEGAYWQAICQSLLGRDQLADLHINDQRHDLLNTYFNSQLCWSNSALKEDAKVKGFQIAYSGAVGNVHDLMADISQFTPLNEAVAEERNKLWAMVLNDLHMQFDQIATNQDLPRYYLRQAACSTGQERLKLAKRTIAVLDNLNALGYIKGNEYRFYRQIARYLIFTTMMHNSRIVDELEGIINDLSPLTDNYIEEGRYLSAICKINMQTYVPEDEIDYSIAMQRLEEIVASSGNVRALYYLGVAYRRMQDNRANSCFAAVIQKTRNIAEAASFYQDARAECPGCADIDLSNGFLIGNRQMTLNDLSFPCATLPDGIYLEQLSDRRYFLDEQIKMAKDFMKKYLLPHLSIYPSQHVLNGSYFAQRVFTDFNSGINDKKGIEFSGLCLNVLPDNINPIVRFDNIPLDPTNNIYIKERVIWNSSHTIKINADNYYPHFERHKFRGYPFDQEIKYRYLTKKVKAIPDAESEQICDLDTIDSNIIFIARSEKRMSSQVKQKLDLLDCRDYVFLPSQKCFLIVSAKRNCILKLNEGSTDFSAASDFIHKFNGQDSLNSPEGIAVTSKGDIYVADWANHRIVVFNSQGLYLRQFGKFSFDSNEEGDTANFIFPTRITIEEDSTGIQLNQQNQHINRDAFLLITDRCGIHRVNLEGIYIEPIISWGSEELRNGAIYAAFSTGYGEDCKLVISYREKTKQALKKFAFTSH